MNPLYYFKSQTQSCISEINETKFEVEWGEFEYKGKTLLLKNSKNILYISFLHIKQANKKQTLRYRTTFHIVVKVYAYLFV